jgi:hypothetical protein
MRSRTKRLPVMLAELALASWQTMTCRMSMIALGTCTAVEYQKMATEKLLAAQRSVLAGLRPSRNPDTAILAPWHRAASANAKRLRRRKLR